VIQPIGLVLKPNKELYKKKQPFYLPEIIIKNAQRMMGMLGCIVDGWYQM
jgi:hypothetical protein